MLPEGQGAELWCLWKEFEASETDTARFAVALDRLQPLLHNQQTEGGTWRIHGITGDRVLERVRPIKEGAPALWPYVQQVIEDCIVAGYLKPEPEVSSA